MHNIIFLDNFLFVKLLWGVFLKFVVLLKDLCTELQKEGVGG